MKYTNTRNYENLNKMIFDGIGQYDIPYIEPVHFEGMPEFISFDICAKANDKENKGVHFFIDDYRFSGYGITWICILIYLKNSNT